MDELDQLAINEIQTSTEDLKVLPDYISGVTDYHLQSPILNKEQLRCMYPECFMVVLRSKTMNIILL